MIQEIQNQFIVQFNQTPLLVKAPGRINLIGEHTDYNNGFVMPAAIDKAMYFAMGKTNESKSIQVQSSNYNEVIFLGDEMAEDQLPSWGRYLKAIAQILSEKGFDITGINCVFGGDIPIGAGLSSSAALCCGFIFGVSTLLDLGIPRTEIALIAQEAEHRIGLNCGLMDQYAVLFGKEDHVFRLDCKDLTFQYFPIVLASHSLVLIDSRIEHQLDGSPYNDRRLSCEQVVKTIATRYPEVETLREVSLEMLNEFEHNIDPIDFIRARFVLQENDRVREMIQALSQGKLNDAGAILYRGHQGVSKEYDISLPEMDLLVDLTRKEESILGARMMGGGFGGCTLNLIENENKEAVLERIQAQYFQATGNQSAMHNVNISDGLKIVS